MISDGNSSLRSGDFVRFGDERTSPTSYARTFECAYYWVNNKPEAKTNRRCSNVTQKSFNLSDAITSDFAEDTPEGLPCLP